VDAKSLARAAALLRERNAIDAELAGLMHQPMTSGHLGEWIAAQIFDIELESSAAAAGIDGHFRSGLLQDCSVNITCISSAKACWTPPSRRSSITTSCSPDRHREQCRRRALPGPGASKRCSCLMRGNYEPGRPPGEGGGALPPASPNSSGQPPRSTPRALILDWLSPQQAEQLSQFGP
jgi:hypothetical protein